MTKEEAFQIVRVAARATSGNADQHELIAQALQTIKAALFTPVVATQETPKIQ